MAFGDADSASGARAGGKRPGADLGLRFRFFGVGFFGSGRSGVGVCASGLPRGEQFQEPSNGSGRAATDPGSERVAHQSDSGAAEESEVRFGINLAEPKLFDR